MDWSAEKSSDQRSFGRAQGPLASAAPANQADIAAGINPVVYKLR